MKRDFGLAHPFALLVVALLSGCSTMKHDERPTVLTVTTEHMFGGEALLFGMLDVHQGCVVVRLGNETATPIFDPGVVWQPDDYAIFDTINRVQVPIGQQFQAGTAHLRRNGSGWSVNDIETLFGVRIPPKCATADIIRLHSFDLTPSRADRDPTSRLRQATTNG